MNMRFKFQFESCFLSHPSLAVDLYLQHLAIIRVKGIQPNQVLGVRNTQHALRVFSRDK